MKDEQSVELQDLTVRANPPQHLSTDSNLPLTRTQDRHLSLYGICFEHHIKITGTFTWLLTIAWAVLVIFGGIVLSGAIWSSNSKSEDPDYLAVGYSFTLVFFIGNFLTLVLSLVTMHLWILRGRLERPASIGAQRPNGLFV